MIKYIPSENSGTKDNPHSIHFLIRALADHEGVSTYVKTNLDQSKELRGKGCTYNVVGFIGKAMHWLDGVKQLTGGKRVYVSGEGNFDLSDFDSLWKIRTKQLRDFKAEVEKVGTYKQCEGGGWYSYVNMYEFKGVYYADIDCSPIMNRVYLKHNNLLPV